MHRLRCLVSLVCRGFSLNLQKTSAFCLCATEIRIGRAHHDQAVLRAAGTHSAAAAAPRTEAGGSLQPEWLEESEGYVRLLGGTPKMAGWVAEFPHGNQADQIKPTGTALLLAKPHDQYEPVLF